MHTCNRWSRTTCSRCAGSWIGQTLSIRGLEETRTSALVRIELDDGRVLQTLLSAAAGSYTVPSRTSPARVFASYLGLGVNHLLTGPDHLLFVLGLLLLVPLGRSLLVTISAFTLAHSLTLSAAILGWVTVPQAPIEVAIAASIVLVAAELAARADGHRSGLSQRPWAMALAFGFLHGLGFAGALAGIGLPVGDIPLALFAFNLGIEIGPRRLDAHVGDLRGHVLAEVPRRDVAVALAGVALGRRDRGELEPWVTGEQADEALPDRAGGAEDRDAPLTAHGVKSDA